jgi:hypothetical protein
MEEFVAYSAYACKMNGSSLEAVLSAYFGSADEAVEAAESEGYVEDGQATRDGLLAAVEFAERTGLAARTLPEQVREFHDVVEAIDEAAEQQAGIGGNRLPEGFTEYESDHRRYRSDQHGYVSNYAKDYADGSRVEVDHRSRDPSGPFEMEPDRASAEARLHHLGRTFTYSRGWDERY